MQTHTVVGVDPTRARTLADGLRRAERALDDAAAAIADDLASCEVTAEGPGAIGAAAAWCGAAALDLLHRIDGVSAGDRLVALLDEEAVPAWLADEHPDLAARRRSALDAIAGLDRERATLAASAYMGVSPSAGRQLRRRITAIDVARSEARAQAEATDDDVEEDVAGLDDAEAEAAARAVGRTFSAVTDEGRRLALAGALQPLRDRLLAELGAAGRALYVGGGPDHGDVDRITHLLDAIAFRPIPPHESKAWAFLDGLVLGDAHPHRYRSPQAAWARTGGHLVSGLFRIGLVRDGLANLVRGHLEEAGADALGLLPLFGDIAKDGKELSTAARAAKDLDRGLATAEHEAAAAERVAARASSLEGEQAWGRPETLLDHVERHAVDLGASTADEYVARGRHLLRRALDEGLPVKVDGEGVVRAWDPATYEFAAYNPDGTLRSYFRATSGGYFDRQPGRLLKGARP